MKLKAAVSSRNVIEVSFASPPPSWAQTLRALPEVDEVEGDEGVFRVSSHDGPGTTMRIMEAAGRAGMPVLSLSVLSTTLDDVFVQCTGHALRDTLQAPGAEESPFLARRG
jgi:ABC-2 type transport system ATP-binding protein